MAAGVGDQVPDHRSGGHQEPRREVVAVDEGAKRTGAPGRRLQQAQHKRRRERPLHHRGDRREPAHQGQRLAELTGPAGVKRGASAEERQHAEHHRGEGIERVPRHDRQLRKRRRDRDAGREVERVLQPARLWAENDGQRAGEGRSLCSDTNQQGQEGPIQFPQGRGEETRSAGRRGDAGCGKGQQRQGCPVDRARIERVGRAHEKDQQRALHRVRPPVPRSSSFGIGGRSTGNSNSGSGRNRPYSGRPSPGAGCSTGGSRPRARPGASGSFPTR